MSVSMEKLNQTCGSSASCKALAREDFPEPEGPSKMISFDEGGMVVLRSCRSGNESTGGKEQAIHFQDSVRMPVALWTPTTRMALTWGGAPGLHPSRKDESIESSPAPFKGRSPRVMNFSKSTKSTKSPGGYRENACPAAGDWVGVEQWKGLDEGFSGQ
jgi:hypothetical protein